jgi:hypothetical protein
LKLILGGLKDKAEELQTFLEPRVGVKPSVSAGELEMEDSAIRKGVKPRHVKTYVKRFLHQKGLRKTFRVLVNGSQLTIQELEREEEEKEEEKKEKEKAAPKKEEEAEEEGKEEEMKKKEAPPTPEKKAGGEEKAGKKKEKGKEKAKSAPKGKKKSEKKKS